MTCRPVTLGSWLILQPQPAAHLQTPVNLAGCPQTLDKVRSLLESDPSIHLERAKK
jgi:hypothetical protein